MITSVFNKSKPLNFTILFILLLSALLLAFFKFNAISLESNKIWQVIVIFIASYFSVLIINFLVYKNNLSHRNNYELLIYGVFVLIIPLTISNVKIICSNLFILMALRKMLSLQSLKYVSKKLFDAGFLIAVATLLNFWSILFLPLAMTSAFFHYDYKARNIVAPILGALSVVIILISTSIIYTNTYTSLLNLEYYISFNYTTYKSLIVSIVLLLSFGIWSIFFYLKQLHQTIKSQRPNYKIILYAVFIGLIIPVISPEKTGAEFLFVIGPLSIIMTIYVENIEEKWFKETLLWLLLVAPLISYLF